MSGAQIGAILDDIRDRTWPLTVGDEARRTHSSSVNVGSIASIEGRLDLPVTH